MCCVCVCDVAASGAAKRYRKSAVGEESGSTPGGVYACVQTPGCWLVLGNHGVASEGKSSFILFTSAFLPSKGLRWGVFLKWVKIGS